MYSLIYTHYTLPQGIINDFLCYTQLTTRGFSWPNSAAKIVIVDRTVFYFDGFTGQLHTFSDKVYKDIPPLIKENFYKIVVGDRLQHVFVVKFILGMPKFT